jgi:hypothetical protein
MHGLLTCLYKPYNYGINWICHHGKNARMQTPLHTTGTMSSVRASPAMVPARPSAAVFFIRMVKNSSVALPVPRFSLDLGLHPSGEPRPSPVPRDALGDSGREKSGDGPALSAREHANPTIWSQIPLSLPSLLCRRRHHPSPIRRPVA